MSEVELEIPVSETEARAACNLILRSDKFLRAPRMRRLLAFLVDAAITGDKRNASEYAIGISALDRNASDYYTSEDPAVRVQVGRLREKLKDYYQSISSEIEITIPLGCYMPCFKRTADLKAARDKTLILDQVACVTESNSGESLALGLQEELSHQLFRFLEGYRIIQRRNLAGGGMPSAGSDMNGEIHHVLECCTRIEPKRTRVSVRLLDSKNGQIHWSAQFDRHAIHDIALQEELAFSICMALKGCFLNAFEVFDHPVSSSVSVPHVSHAGGPLG
jgi:TolB-like protein